MSNILLPAPGTVTVTNGSDEISGTGTAFSVYRVGYRINLPDGLSVVLASDPTSDGTAKITQAFTGATITNSQFAVTAREIGSQIALEQRILSEMLRATDVLGVSASWKFSGVLTDSQPNAGHLRFNNADPESVTEIYIIDQDSRDLELGAWIDMLDGGQLGIRSAVRPNKMVIYTINDISDETGYRKLTVAHVSGEPDFQTDEDLAVVGALPGQPGLPGINWKGTYSGPTEYIENDGVLNAGSSWRALQSTQGNSPPNLPTTANAFWFLVAASGEGGSDLPEPTSGDAGKVVAVNGTEDGFELAAAGAGGSIASAPMGRLSLTAGNPLMSANVASSGTVYYVPFAGPGIPIWDDTNSEFVMEEFSAMSLTLNSGQHLNGHNYDVGVFNNGGTLRLACGPSWSNLFSRSASIVRPEGIWKNSGSITVTWGGSSASIDPSEFTVLGSINMTGNGVTKHNPRPADSNDGQTAGIYLSNMYNTVSVQCLFRATRLNGWNGPSSQSTRAINNNSNARFDLMAALPTYGVVAQHRNSGNHAASGKGGIGFGLNTSSARASVDPLVIVSSSVTVLNYIADYVGTPGQGLQKLYAIEYSQHASNAVLWLTRVTTPWTLQCHEATARMAA